MSGFRAFLAELRRRKVWLMAGVYVVSAWIIAQVASLVLPNFAAPGWVMPVLLIVLGLGLPLAIILAWAQETQAKEELETSEQIVEKPAILDPMGVAVLPFENLSPDPDNAYFAAGVHEEILNQLAKVRALNVIARTSVLQYEATRKPMPEIAAELSVGSILEGSVRYDGNQVRVTAQLIDGVGNVQLWSDTFDRNLEGIFAIQSEVAMAIATALRATLTKDEADAIDKKPTQNLAAYSELLRAQAVLRRGSTLAGYDDAIAHIDRALELDPGFALAMARKAGFISIGLSEFDHEFEPDAARTAQRLADQALALDPFLGEAYWAKGIALAYFNEWDAASAAFRKGVELAPGEAIAHSRLGGHLICVGQTEEALLELEKAIAIDPLSAIGHSRTAITLAQLGQFEKAVKESEISLSLDPGSLRSAIDLIALLMLNGQQDAAIMRLHLAEKLDEASDPDGRMSLAGAWAIVGERDRARNIAAGIDFSEVRARQHAGYLVGMGESDAAIDVLQAEFARVGRIPAWTHAFLSLLTLHDDPRYKAVMAETGVIL